jgi:uncharacterized protein (TIGR02246 family)
MSALARSLIVVILVACSSALFGQDQVNSGASPAPTRANDEAQIRANIDAFVKAYNARDTKAVASLFAPNAQAIDEDGTTSQGRDAIEKTFAAMFAAEPQAQIKVDVRSIRFIGSAVAVESGRTKVTPNPGEEPDVTRYTVVHIKSPDGKWQMGFVRDTGAEPSNYEELKPLEWMIGDWVDESPDSVVTTSCKWSDDKNFILQEIKVRMRGHDTMHLNQRIGYDPLTKQIRAWLFDSEGGFGESFWTHDGNRWIAKATAVRHDGTTASMTNVFTPTGKDSYTWRSIDRVVGGEVLPPLEVKIARKAPEAAK